MRDLLKRKKTEKKPKTDPRLEWYKTPDEHNRETEEKERLRQEIGSESHVICPRCKEQGVFSWLYYTPKGIVLSSNPPRHPVYCRTEGCGYRGYILL